MIKRCFDFFCAFLGIILLSPLFLLVSLWVLIDSGLPVFYCQVRVGKGGVDFMLLKFRTMLPGSEAKGLLTVGKDARVTKAGRFLRKYRFDEIPQLWNVMCGEMSLVGPRPEVRKYVNLYSDAQKKALSVRPGITDRASIEYVNEHSLLAASADPEQTYITEVMPAKLKISIAYMERAGFFSDLGIIFLTLVRISAIKST